MDSKGHLASAKGHITSTLIGNMNRNGWQQLKVGRLGGHITMEGTLDPLPSGGLVNAAAFSHIMSGRIARQEYEMMPCPTTSMTLKWRSLIEPR